MIYAIDLSNSATVEASDPKLHKGLKFRCPVCQAPVHLRKGISRVPYFAHNSSSALPSCELYTPGTVDGSHSQNLQIREPNYRTLNLYINLIEEASNVLSWSLELGIPETNLTNGRIEVPFGWDGRRVVPIKYIKQGGLRLRIKPQIYNYNILTEGIYDCKWKDRVSNTIEGIDQSKLTVFRYSIHGGRRLNKGSLLYWGRYYIIVWTSGHGPLWWPNKEMEIKHLKSQGNFHGALIRLPIKKTGKVMKWITEYLISHSIIHPPAELKLITPLPNAILNDGSYVIPFGQKVYIGIAGESGARKWGLINGYHWDSEAKISIRGLGKIPAHFELSPGLGRSDLWLDDEIEECLQIIVEKNSSDTFFELPSIKLIASYKGSSSLVECLLHSSEIEKLLDEAFSGNINITKAEIPLNIPIDLMWKEYEIDAWQIESYQIEDLDKKDQISMDFIASLNAIVDRKAKFLSIEAGSFGRVDYISKKSTRNLVLNIGKSVRAKGKLLLSLSRNQASNSLLDYRPNFDLKCFCLEDQDILKKIINKCYWPIALTPNVRAVLYEYGRLYEKYRNQGE